MATTLMPSNGMLAYRHNVPDGHTDKIASSNRAPVGANNMNRIAS